LDIEALACGRDLLAEQQGTPVAKAGEIAILMPCVGLGDGLSSMWQNIACEQRRVRILVERVSG
jgi:hypothetical protein